MSGNDDRALQATPRTLNQCRDWIRARLPGLSDKCCVRDVVGAIGDDAALRDTLWAAWLHDLPGDAAWAIYYLIRDCRDLLGDELARALALRVPDLPGDAAWATYCLTHTCRYWLGDDLADELAARADDLRRAMHMPEVCQ